MDVLRAQNELTDASLLTVLTIYYVNIQRKYQTKVLFRRENFHVPAEFKLLNKDLEKLARLPL